MQSPLVLGLFLFSFMLLGVVHVANADVPSPLLTDSIDAQTMFFETTTLDVFNVVEEPNMIYKCRGCAAPDTVPVTPTENRDDSDTLYGAVFIETVQIGGSHYALVGFYYDRDIQIINVTDPASPVETAYVTERDEGFTELGAVNSIATAQIGGSHYALVASKSDGGLQMIDITDPASPTAVAGVGDWFGGVFSVTTAQIGDSHYALVARYLIDGIQIIDITDPASPMAVASVTDGNNGFAELFKATSITTTQIKDGHYALVASKFDNGVQIIDITDPASPRVTASISDGKDGFTELGGARSITTTQIKDGHYALVASFLDDGIQIIDITDPASPMAVASVTDGKDGFTKLVRATSITTTQIGGSHYALVTSRNDASMQIIDITDPASPTAVASVTDGKDGFTKLGRAFSVTTAQIGGSHYALVASLADDGIQIIDITNPINPLLPLTASATDPAGGTVAATIRMWSGFEPGSVTDAQLLDALNLGHGREIPDWMMTHLGILFSEDRITLEEFTTALSYVLEKT